MRTLLILVAVCGCTLAVPGAAVSQTGVYEVEANAVQSGGRIADPISGYSIDGTVGQPATGSLSAGQYTLDAGFWPAAMATTTTSSTTTSTLASSTTTTTTIPTTLMSTTTTVVPSTAPTTVTTSIALTTTVTTSTVTASTATAPTATTSTGIPTTTTRPPFCGDGHKNVDLGEECDDGDPLSEIDCCNQNCRFRPQFSVCGQAAVGPCAKPSTCDGNGMCVPHVKDLGSFDCRDVGEFDDCDLGDSCDGASAECPTIHRGAGCMAETPDTVRKPLINVKCEAILRPESGDSNCEASGTDASAALLGDDAAAVSGGLVTETIRKTLKKLKNGTYQRVLKLHLNAVGKRVLRERGNLPVRVSITINHGRAHGHEVIRVVNVVKKKK